MINTSSMDVTTNDKLITQWVKNCGDQEEKVYTQRKRLPNILNRLSGYFYMVVSDIPESENDPNYRYTYSRLYKPTSK
jgi:uncharacterized membrane protein